MLSKESFNALLFGLYQALLFCYYSIVSFFKLLFCCKEEILDEKAEFLISDIINADNPIRRDRESDEIFVRVLRKLEECDSTSGEL